MCIRDRDRRGVASTTRCRRSARRPIRRSSRRCPAQTAGRAARPVSYTHLDVYKRQVVRRAVAIAHQFKHARRINLVLATGQQLLGLCLQCSSLIETQAPATQVSRQNASELAAPEQRSRPFRITAVQRLGGPRVFTCLLYTSRCV